MHALFNRKRISATPILYQFDTVRGINLYCQKTPLDILGDSNLKKLSHANEVNKPFIQK